MTPETAAPGPLRTTGDGQSGAAVASDPAGLTSAEAARRLADEGLNEIPSGARRPWLRILAAQLRSPFVGILIAAAAISYLLHERIEATVILLIVALNTTLGFIQEYHADRSLAALRRYVIGDHRYLRDPDPPTMVPEQAQPVAGRNLHRCWRPGLPASL
jgi:magnesium-transporting ATPase (P-type)